MSPSETAPHDHHDVTQGTGFLALSTELRELSEKVAALQGKRSKEGRITAALLSLAIALGPALATFVYQWRKAESDYELAFVDRVLSAKTPEDRGALLNLLASDTRVRSSISEWAALEAQRLEKGVDEQTSAVTSVVSAKEKVELLASKGHDATPEEREELKSTRATLDTAQRALVTSQVKIGPALPTRRLLPPPELDVRQGPPQAQAPSESSVSRTARAAAFEREAILAIVRGDMNEAKTALDAGIIVWPDYHSLVEIRRLVRVPGATAKDVCEKVLKSYSWGLSGELRAKLTDCAKGS